MKPYAEQMKEARQRRAEIVRLAKLDPPLSYPEIGRKLTPKITGQRVGQILRAEGYSRKP